MNGRVHNITHNRLTGANCVIEAPMQGRVGTKTLKQNGPAYSGNWRKVSVTSELWRRIRTRAEAEVRSRSLDFILISMGRFLKGAVILEGLAINFPVVSSTSMKCKDFLICGFLRGNCNCSFIAFLVCYMMNLLS